MNQLPVRTYTNDTVQGFLAAAALYLSDEGSVSKDNPYYYDAESSFLDFQPLFYI